MWLQAARERHLLLSTGLSQRPRTRSGPLAAPVYPHPVPRPDPVQQASLMDADHRPPGGVPNLMPSPQLELQLGPQQLEVSSAACPGTGNADGACWAQGCLFMCVALHQRGAWCPAVRSQDVAAPASDKAGRLGPPATGSR